MNDIESTAYTHRNDAAQLSVVPSYDGYTGLVEDAYFIRVMCDHAGLAEYVRPEQQPYDQRSAGVRLLAGYVGKRTCNCSTSEVFSYITAAMAPLLA